MKIDLKSKKEIEIMRAGGKIASYILNELKKSLKPGITTKEIENMTDKLIERNKVKASFKGYRKYPACICISVNEEIVHGLPSDRVLKEGDIISLDLGIFYKGFHSDTAITCPIGEITPQARKLIAVTKKALQEGIKDSREGNFLGNVQNTIQNVIEKQGFGVIKDLVGHGIGKNLQESPTVPNYGKPGTGSILQEGMTLAIEPMVAVGGWEVKISKDGWTVVTLDKSLSAHFEHTIAITKKGPIILTE